MLSWFPLVVVVDGGSKQAVHVVVWGGTANECLRSVSKRTNKLEPNPLQLSPETLTFRTLDHRMVAARVPTGGAKGQDQRGEEEACLMMMHGATNPPCEAPTTTKLPQTPTQAQLKEGDVTNLYVWVAVVVVMSVVPHTRLGQGETSKTGGVHKPKLLEYCGRGDMAC